MSPPPTATTRSVLVVDDDADVREMLEDLLAQAQIEVAAASSGAEALAVLGEREFDAVLADVHMPGQDGFELVVAARALRPETPVLLMTGHASVESAITAMRSGAFDYVTKPFRRDELFLSLERAFEHRALEDENRRLRRAVERASSFGELVGKSPAMNELYALIRRISSSSSSVLITGESGTGKEVVARTVHFTGSRAQRPFVPINCAALPEGLLESELFGHVRGAFTGAYATKKGLFEAAEGGSVFLDEIGDMPTHLQGKLLRALEDGEVRPVGGTRAVPVDVRIIAATNRPLEEAIRDGSFRLDLYYRLNVIPIALTPLRERTEDIPILADAFLRKHAESDRHRLSEGAVRKLMQAPWPGNARELENCIERAVALARSSEIRAEDILVSSERTPRSDDSLREILVRCALSRRLSAHELTEAYIDAALAAADGRKSLAARMLGMNRRTLYRREQRLSGPSAS